MTIFNLILISIIVCYVIDISGFITSIKRQFLRKVFKSKNPDISSLNWKPFDCSRCLTLYSGLIYLAIVGKFTIPYITIVAILSMLSSNISGLLLTIKDYLAAFEMWLQKLIQK